MRYRCILLLLVGLAAGHGFGQALYTVEALDIRPTGADFAPVLVDSSIIFTSVRARAQAISYTDASTDKPFADLYRVRLHGGKPGRPQLMDGTLCSRFNDGPAAFSPSGDTICFTRNGKGDRRNSDLLSLFFATRTGKVWSEPAPFVHNVSGFSTMGAGFSKDGQRLYFSSDRPGGKGGMDIWMCLKDGDHWSDPTNLGPAVNSAANEAYPSAGPDGGLFFSSDRAGGQGRMDIYACTFEYGEFSPPVPLPAPLNSPGNELGFTTGTDALSGYFSSDRTGEDQIYRFHVSPELFRDCIQQSENSYCYHFEDAGTTESDTLPLRYEWDLGDGAKVAALSTDHCYTTPGTYEVKLNLMDTLSKSVYFNQVNYELTVTDAEQAHITSLDSAGTGQPLVFDTTHTNLPGFEPKEIHWDFGDSAKASGASAAHAYAQAGTYTVKMDLVGRPDGRGGFLHHCAMRVMRVIDGITVAPSGLTGTATTGMSKASSLGTSERFNYEELPADAFNMHEAEDKDLPFTVQLFASALRVSLNDARFIPIRPFYPVVERFSPAERKYTYSISSGTTPVSVYGAFALARKAGFTESEVKRMPKEKPVDMDKVEDLPLEKLNNTLVRISTVRFGSGEHVVDDSFNTVLDKLLGVLVKYPQLSLVIEAHTDNVGKAAENMALSQSRAQAVLDYFTGHGIDAARLQPIGFGEERPIASNTTSDGRALNRRVEFRLSLPEGANTTN